MADYTLSHLSGDAKLPSYCHPLYNAAKPALDVTEAVWNGLYGKKADYLPRSPQEPVPAWNRRVESAVFNNKFRGQIESISGLLTAFDMEDLPPSFNLAEEDGLGLDGNGSDWKGFLRTADELALRDGLVFILTNNALLDPDAAEMRTMADPPTHPQFTIIPRRRVLNWRHINRGGIMVLSQVTIMVDTVVDMDEFGATTRPFYHVYRLEESGVSRTIYEVNDRGNIILIQDPQLVEIDVIPLVTYPDITNPFPTTDGLLLPYLLKTAELNLKLFKQESLLDTIQFRVNSPTVYRISGMPFEDRPPIIFGPNHVIELMRDTGGTTTGQDQIGIVEIAGSGIAALAEAVEKTKREIDEEGVGFLGGGTIKRSATEAYLSATRASASLNGFARAKEQAVMALVADWCRFTGEEIGDAALSMDQSVLEQPLDAAEMNTLFQITQGGLLDHQTFLELLRMGKQLPPSISIDEILQRVEEEKEKALPQPAALQNSLGGIDVPSRLLLEDDVEDEQSEDMED
jgi:hypothetical protein